MKDRTAICIYDFEGFVVQAEATQAIRLHKTALHLNTFSYRCPLFSLSKLIDRFEGRLKKLHLAGTCSTSASDNDVSSLVASLSACTELSDITCFSRGYYGHRHGPLAFRIVHPLLVRPGNVLKKIQVVGVWAGLSESFFSACAASTILQELSFHSLDLDEDQFRDLGKLVRESLSLESLEVGGHLASAGNALCLSHLILALQENRFLKKLHLDLPHGSFRGYEMEVKLFCAALQRNNTIQDLLVTPWKEKRRPRRWELKHAFQPSSESVEPGFLEFASRLEIAEKEMDAFRANLSGIYFLEAFNKSRRDELCSPNATNDDWFETISQQWDVPLIYFLLRQNPALCDLAAASKQPVEGKCKAVPKKSHKKSKKRRRS